MRTLVSYRRRDQPVIVSVIRDRNSDKPESVWIPVERTRDTNTN